MWFGLYSRGKGKLSSSGFEHVFVSELRNSEVLGKIKLFIYRTTNMYVCMCFYRDLSVFIVFLLYDFSEWFSGLHNWIYFAKEESENRVNYLGYLKYQKLGDVSV